MKAVIDIMPYSKEHYYEGYYIEDGIKYTCIYIDMWCNTNTENDYQIIWTGEQPPDIDIAENCVIDKFKINNNTLEMSNTLVLSDGKEEKV